MATGLSTDQLTATVEKRLPRLTNEIDLRAAEMDRLLASSLPLEFLHFIEITLQRFRGELSAENPPPQYLSLKRLKSLFQMG
jgi:hypothetical protein